MSRAQDAEHGKNLQLDVWRQMQLSKHLANPQHPFARFHTGNKDTLGEQPRAKGLDIRQARTSHAPRSLCAPSLASLRVGLLLHLRAGLGLDRLANLLVVVPFHAHTDRSVHARCRRRRRHRPPTYAAPTHVFVQAVEDFHASHYSANLMRLAVVGRHALDDLERMVRAHFAAVPTKQLPVPAFPGARRTCGLARPDARELPWRDTRAARRAALGLAGRMR